MADIDNLRRYLGDVQSGLQSINDLSLEIEEQSENLVSNLASFAGIGTKGGIVRSILTRASTGTGLFNLTQRLTSALLLFKYIDKSQKERLKEEQEFNKLMASREKTMIRLFRMTRDHEKAQAKQLSVLEKERYYNDESIRMKLKTMTIDEAILESSNQLMAATSKLRKAGRSALGGKAQRFLLSGGAESLGVSRFRGGAQGAALLQMGANELKAQQERVRGLEGEAESTKNEYNLLKAAFDKRVIVQEKVQEKNPRFTQGRDDVFGGLFNEPEFIEVIKTVDKGFKIQGAEREAAKENLKFMRDAVRQMEQTREDANDNLDRLIKEFLEDKEDIEKRTGITANLGGGQGVFGGVFLGGDEGQIRNALDNDEDLIESVEQLTLIGQAQLKLEQTRDKIKERLEKIRGYFGGEDFKILRSFMFKGLLVFGGLILGMSALVALIFILYRVGIGEWLVNTGKTIGELFEKNSDALEMFKEGFSLIFGGFWDIFTGFIGVVFGLLSGDGNLISESSSKFFNGLEKLGVGIINLAVGGFVSGIELIMFTIFGMGKAYLDGIFGKAESAAGTVGGIAGSAAGAYSGMKAGAFLGAKFGPKGALIGGTIGFIGGAVAGGNLGVEAGDKLAGAMANGGTTRTSGTYLVGERGPELVSLPGNTRVFNNSDTSRMMSPTININVTGRVGASDTELNDIARKIGQKINIEMNRYNSSGLRG
jgi:predicted RNase H-like HicB family nuclease